MDFLKKKLHSLPYLNKILIIHSYCEKILNDTFAFIFPNYSYWLSIKTRQGFLIPRTNHKLIYKCTNITSKLVTNNFK